MKEIKKTYLFFLVLFIVLPAVFLPDGKPILAANHTYYVDCGAGNDSNAGNEEKPFGSMQKAADTVQPGDIVIVKDGIYNESVDIKISGNKDEAIIFLAEHAGSVLLDGEGTLRYGFKLENGDYVRIEGFSFVNYSSYAIVGSESVSCAEIVNNDICGMTENAEAAVKLNKALKSSIQSNRIHDIGCDGIVSMTGGTNAFISNTFHNITARAIVLNFEDNSLISANTFDTVDTALYLCEKSKAVAVRGNSILGCGTALLLDSAERITLGYNVIENPILFNGAGNKNITFEHNLFLTTLVISEGAESFHVIDNIVDGIALPESGNYRLSHNLHLSLHPSMSESSMGEGSQMVADKESNFADYGNGDFRLSPGGAACAIAPLTGVYVGPKYMLADLNGDREITDEDIDLIVDYIMNREMLSLDALEAGDVSGNGEVSGIDGSYIWQYIQGDIDKFPVEVR